MPIPASISDLQTVDSSNSPQGGDPVGGNIDDYFRAHAGILARQFKQGADIPSAAMLAIPMDGTFFNVTGTVAITQFANAFNGKIVFLRFGAALTLTNSGSLVLPGNVDYITSVGEILQFVQLGASQWSCISYRSVAADGSVVMTGTLTVTDGTDSAGYPSNGDVAGSGIPGGSISAMNTALNSSIATKQANLGFTPVKQSSLNTIALGWSGSAVQMQVDANPVTTLWHSGNFDPATKAGAGAQVQWQSAVVQFSAIQLYSSGGTIDATLNVPAPYVMVGLHVYPQGTASSNAYLLGVALKNQ